MRTRASKPDQLVKLRASYPPQRWHSTLTAPTAWGAASGSKRGWDLGGGTGAVLALFHSSARWGLSRHPGTGWVRSRTPRSVLASSQEAPHREDGRDLTGGSMGGNQETGCSIYFIQMQFYSKVVQREKWGSFWGKDSSPHLNSILD